MGQTLGLDEEVFSARLTFTNIYDWTVEPNELWITLLNDRADHPYSVLTVSVIGDNPGDTNNGNYFGSYANASAITVLDQGHSLFNMSTTPTTRNYDFTASELAALQSYLADDGNCALGIDPDCHFYNCGVTFTIDTETDHHIETVPEPASIVGMFGGLLAAGGAAARRMRMGRLAK